MFRLVFRLVFLQWRACLPKHQRYAIAQSVPTFTRCFILRQSFFDTGQGTLSCSCLSRLKRPFTARLRVCAITHTPSCYLHANIATIDNIYKSIFVPTFRSLQFFLHVRIRTPPQSRPKRTSFVRVTTCTRPAT